MELFTKIRDFNPVEELFGEWQPLRSSNPNGNLQAWRYNEGKRLLEIQFHGGRVYQYPGVPKDVAEGLGAAESPGAYFNGQIRHSYSAGRT